MVVRLTTSLDYAGAEGDTPGQGPHMAVCPRRTDVARDAARARGTVAASNPEWGTGTVTFSSRGLGELLRVPERFL